MKEMRFDARQFLQGLYRQEGLVPSMPTSSEPSLTWAKRASALLAEIDDPERRADLRFRFEERAGIVEFEGGLPHDEAERLAFEEIHKLTLVRGAKDDK